MSEHLRQSKLTADGYINGDLQFKVVCVCNTYQKKKKKSKC